MKITQRCRGGRAAEVFGQGGAASSGPAAPAPAAHLHSPVRELEAATEQFILSLCRP